MITAVFQVLKDYARYQQRLVCFSLIYQISQLPHFLLFPKFINFLNIPNVLYFPNFLNFPGSLNILNVLNFPISSTFLVSLTFPNYTTFSISNFRNFIYFLNFLCFSQISHWNRKVCHLLWTSVLLVHMVRQVTVLYEKSFA